jgi:hypothetical protein
VLPTEFFHLADQVLLGSTIAAAPMLPGSTTAVRPNPLDHIADADERYRPTGSRRRTLVAISTLIQAWSCQ